MTMVLWLVLIAAMLPVMCAGLAKYGSKEFDNHNPREWMTRLEGWRARANAAQSNTFEALPFFFIAVALAVYTNAPLEKLHMLMIAWLLARLAYVWFYIRDKSTLRSIVWALGVGLSIAILFAGRT
ncbi:MAPEG family protein [Pigmentiphaga litoralis]|uniref:MAPEG family protein n=1 Tax=Pigmentiphaga litoralis TaxID=516702 RepID=UPI003B4314FC